MNEMEILLECVTARSLELTSLQTDPSATRVPVFPINRNRDSEAETGILLLFLWPELGMTTFTASVAMPRNSDLSLELLRQTLSEVEFTVRFDPSWNFSSKSVPQEAAWKSHYVILPHPAENAAFHVHLYVQMYECHAYEASRATREFTPSATSCVLLLSCRVIRIMLFPFAWGLDLHIGEESRFVTLRSSPLFRWR